MYDGPRDHPSSTSQGLLVVAGSGVADTTVSGWPGLSSLLATMVGQAALGCTGLHREMKQQRSRIACILHYCCCCLFVCGDSFTDTYLHIV